ncbi:class I adenylate-forming enzyme family protein [Pacificimonas sp. ICDLI1SI03]
MTLLQEFRDKLLATNDDAVLEFEGRQFTRREIAALSQRLGALLTDAGVPQDAFIGLVMRNRPLHVVAVMGLILAGRPITSIYALQKPALLAREIAETGFAAVIADIADLSDPVVKAIGDNGGVAIVLDLGAEEEISVTGTARTVDTAERHHLITGEPGLELLSSGTTGKPKRIFFPFRMLVRSVETVRAGVSAGDVPPDICTWSLAGIAMGNIVANIMIDRYMVLIDRFNVPEWVTAVRRLRPAYVTGPPAVAQMVVDANVPAEDLASIDYFYGGSAPMPVPLQQTLLERYGIAVIWAYGATEFCGTIISWSLDLYRRFGKEKKSAMGRPLPNVRVRIVDTSTGQRLADGEVGYLEAIVPEVAEDWIRTTDLARIDEDGFVYHCGRGDGAIMRGGFKILPETIVDALTSHPLVLEAGVVGLEDRRLGEVPVAVVQLTSEAGPIDGQALRDYLRDQVPATYVPSEIRVIDVLPRTSSMKVDLGAIKRMFEVQNP